MRENTTYEEKKQIIVDYYSTKERYIYRKEYSTPQQEVYTKENNKFLWLTLEQKSSTQIEVRQTDHNGHIIVVDSYELTGNIPKYTGSDRIIEADVYKFIHFNKENLDAIHLYGRNSKEEGCRNMSDMLQTIDNRGTMKKIVGKTLEKIKLLSSESYEELKAVVRKMKDKELADAILNKELDPDDYIITDAVNKKELDSLKTLYKEKPVGSLTKNTETDGNREMSDSEYLIMDARRRKGR